MKNLSERILNIAPSLTVAVDTLAKKLKAEGKDIDKLSCDNFRKKYGHWRLKDIKKLIELEEK